MNFQEPQIPFTNHLTSGIRTKYEKDHFDGFEVLTMRTSVDSTTHFNAKTLRQVQNPILECAEKIEQVLISQRTKAAARLGQRYDHKAWMKKVEDLGWRCVYCNKQLTRLTLTQDHVIPRRRGGSWRTENLVPSCTECNTRKGNKPVDVFLAEMKEKQFATAAVNALVESAISKNAPTALRKAFTSFFRYQIWKQV